MTPVSGSSPIATVEVHACPSCRKRGERLHTNLRDEWLGTPGTWNIMLCRRCALAWMSPKPEWQELGKLYGEGYHTHSSSPPPPPASGFLRRIMRAASSPDRGGMPSRSALERFAASRMAATRAVRDLVEGAFMWAGPPPGELLDVGCANGEFLVRMRDRGWKVRGIEPDPASARIATDHHGLDVTMGTLEESQLPASSVDVITMSHVIEHVHDPVAALRECARILRPGGRLIAVTPNLRSLGRRWFGERWMGWDVPRHLHVFSPQSLRSCVHRAGLDVHEIRTTARSTFRQVPSMTRFITMQQAAGGRDRARYRSLGFWFLEHSLTRLMPCGEEILLIARSR